MVQAGVGYLRVVEIQILKLGQTLETLQPGVVYLRAAKRQAPKIR